MTREQLEHLIGASAPIADDDEIVIVGSQSVLGQFSSAPAELLVSDEADVYPKNRPERAELIDGSIGEGSMFHETFGYYAQGVAPETAVLPAGWQGRVIAVRGPGTRGATGLCLEIHDLVVSKLVAGREKDLEFAAAALRHGLVDAGTLRARIEQLAVDEPTRAVVRARVASL